MTHAERLEKAKAFYAERNSLKAEVTKISALESKVASVEAAQKQK